MPLIMLLLIATLFSSPALFASDRANLLARGTPVVLSDTDALKNPTTAPQAKVPERALFDRLVGIWDVSYEIYDKDGNVRRYNGQASYTWILDGAALQEVWTSDAHNKEPRPYGTTIGFYDGKRQCWTSIWIYPAQGMTTMVTGHEADGRIVLTGPDQAGAMQRWSIGDIRSDSFVGRFESSTDEGKSWRLLGVNHMHRHHA